MVAGMLRLTGAIAAWILFRLRILLTLYQTGWTTLSGSACALTAIS